MRYGLKFADGDPFPKDVNFGIQLEDETPIDVPPECPECPECPPAGNCEVECWGWQVASFQAVGEGGFPYFSVNIEQNPGVNTFLRYPEDFTEAGNTETQPIGYVRGQAFAFSVFGNFCGHKIRYVEDVGSTIPHTTVHSETLTHGETGIFLIFDDYGTDFGPGGTITAQIDLTDAPEGEETWTDICGVIRVLQAGGV